VDRTISVNADDQFRFAPDAIIVRAGETVAFRITNSGYEAHEFVVVDATAQDEDERAMSLGSMPTQVGRAALDIPAGRTRTLVYTFRGAGSLIYGCHIARHYAAGKRGTITVTPS